MKKHCFYSFFVFYFLAFCGFVCAEDAAPAPAPAAAPAPAPAPAADFFASVPAAVALPECTKGDYAELMTLETGDKTVTFELLGGSTAFPAKASSKKKKNADAEKDANGFTLEKGENKGDAAIWKIKYNQRGKTVSAALLSHDGKKLKFKWNTKVPAKFLEPLGNCALKMTVDSSTHYTVLRESVTLESLVLNQKTATGSIRGSKMACPFPSLETVYVEILNLGEYQAGGTDVVIPPPTKASEIGPKEPLQIKFNFTDSNGNASTPVYFDVVPTFGNNFTASILPPKELAKQLPAMMQIAQDPQVDIHINNLQKEIASLEKKLEDKPGWQRDAADTTKITQNQMQIWLISKLKTLSTADAKMRVYIDFGEFQANIITTETMTVEQKMESKKASRKGSSKKGKNADADAEDEGGNDLGGMKF